MAASSPPTTHATLQAQINQLTAALAAVTPPPNRKGYGKGKGWGKGPGKGWSWDDGRVQDGQDGPNGGRRRLQETPVWTCLACGWDMHDPLKQECRNRLCGQARPGHTLNANAATAKPASLANAAVASAATPAARPARSAGRFMQNVRSRRATSNPQPQDNRSRHTLPVSRGYKIAALIAHPVVAAGFSASDGEATGASEPEQEEAKAGDLLDTAQEAPPESHTLTTLRRTLEDAKADGDLNFASQVQSRIDALTRTAPPENSSTQRKQLATISNDTVRLERQYKAAIKALEVDLMALDTQQEEMKATLAAKYDELNAEFQRREETLKDDYNRYTLEFKIGRVRSNPRL